MVTKHVQVRGRVQGVGFRQWTREQAGERAVSGWVRNCPDGSVEAVLSGPDDAVTDLIAALNQGPPAALVEDIGVADATAPAEPGFRIVG